MFVEGDVSVAADAKALVEAAVEHYGRLDCAFNNAGIEGLQALTVNLKGAWLCMKYEVPIMLRQGLGFIAMLIYLSAGSKDPEPARQGSGPAGHAANQRAGAVG